jgi:hypothetical protein
MWSMTRLRMRDDLSSRAVRNAPYGHRTADVLLP